MSMMITFYENVDINTPIEPIFLESFKVTDLIERIQSLEEVLPKYKNLSPSPMDIIEKLGKIDWFGRCRSEQNNLFLINSVLINFHVYLEIAKRLDLDKWYQAAYESDLSKLNELINREKL
ncbi:hypothetical protein SBP32_004279 [Vibrio parahaemolyticus]|nr:hypothetical protein [Vibrio parahaemolyticus]